MSGPSSSGRGVAARAVTSSLVLAALWGCERDPRWTRPLEILGPVAAAERLVFANAGAEVLVLLEPNGEAPTAHLPLLGRPVALAAAGDRVLVLGHRAGAPHLEVIELPSGARRQVNLPGAYDRLLVAPDGEAAVLLYDASAPPRPGVPAARNLNEIAVVDLSAGRAERVVLETESIAPRDVVWSPSGELAAVVLDAALALIDVTDPSRRLRVPLKLPGGEALTPEEVLFAPGGGQLFVRAGGTRDVLALEVTRSAAGLAASLNFLFLPGAERLRDIAVSSAEGLGGRVVGLWDRAGGGSLAAVLEGSGAVLETRVVTLAERHQRLEELGGGLFLLHGSPARLGERGGAALAVWEPGEDRLHEDRLAGPTTAPPVIARGAVFFQHLAGVGGPPAMTAVAVEATAARLRLRQSPLAVTGTLQGVAPLPGGDGVLLGVDVPRRDSGAAPQDDSRDQFYGTTGALVVVNDALDIEGLVLDASIGAVGSLGDSYFALHPDPRGDVTFVPRATPTRAAARRVSGYLLTGLLAEREDQP